MANPANTPLRKRRLGRQGLEAAEIGSGAMGWPPAPAGLPGE
jgi:hypothetical protein